MLDLTTDAEMEHEPAMGALCECPACDAVRRARVQAFASRWQARQQLVIAGEESGVRATVRPAALRDRGRAA